MNNADLLEALSEARHLRQCPPRTAEIRQHGDMWIALLHSAGQTARGFSYDSAAEAEGRARSLISAAITTNRQFFKR